MVPNSKFEVVIEGRRYVAHGDAHGRIGSIERQDVIVPPVVV